MTATEHTTHLDMHDVLRGEISATTLLLETIAAEHNSIIKSDAAALECAAHDKEQALLHLQQLEQQRIALVEATGFNPDPDGMAAYLQSASTGVDLSALWEQLMEQTASCRDQNRENYQLVEMYSQHTRQVLCILRGEDPDQEIYGPAGMTRDGHERRSLAKA